MTDSCHNWHVLASVVTVRDVTCQALFNINWCSVNWLPIKEHAYAMDWAKNFVASLMRETHQLCQGYCDNITHIKCARDAVIII